MSNTSNFVNLILPFVFLEELIDKNTLSLGDPIRGADFRFFFFFLIIDIISRAVF